MRALTDCIEISSFITLLRKYYFGEHGRDAAVVSALSLTNLARFDSVPVPHVG